MKTQRITLSMGLVLLAVLLIPAESRAIELLAARNETWTDHAFQHLADTGDVSVSHDRLTMAETMDVKSFERSSESIELLPPKSADWALQESDLLQTQLYSETEKTGQVALGLIRGKDVIERTMILSDAERKTSISPAFLAAFVLVMGVLIGSKLGVWRIVNQVCFVFAARAQGMSVSTRRRQHRRRARSQRNRRGSWYFRSARPSRRRTRSHKSRSGATSRQSSWRPQNPAPSYRRGGSTREYVVSDVVFTTNGPIARATQRVTPPLITLQY